MSLIYRTLLLICIISLAGCGRDEVLKKTSKEKTLFTRLDKPKTNIDFTNNVKQDSVFNYINYPYAFTGGGVAVGDVNNDGLQDIYFTSNQNSNKLYLNTGNFQFEDVTEEAGVEDSEGWTSGVTMIDINNDGWMDIYVCKSASLDNSELRKNKLYINQKDGTFIDQAEKWGLDHNGFSIQAYFFDFDKDGDLDMYLVNHRPDFQNTNKIIHINEKEYFPETSDHLFRNDVGSFSNITLQSGIINKEWGLSASIGDFNNDDWPDIYVANDYIGPDFLYINNKNGTFSNQINTRFKHISYNSMGSDYADINNDFLPDLLVLDMLAEDHQRGKQNMASMNTEGFQMMVNAGYHYAYMSNVLQLNNGNGSFSDIGQLAGISKTDWSWAPLIADFDNDGFKDIFISNGIERELGNQDYRTRVRELQQEKESVSFSEMMEIMPSDELANYVFKNNGDLTFKNTTSEWGLDDKINTNGVAYADFDNDGDLDLVLNNSSGNASIYKNNSVGNFISIKLVGDKKNINGIGTKVKVYTPKNQQYQVLYTSRGYQSSISNILNFGLGEETEIDRIEVIWGDDTVLAAENIQANQTLTFNKKESKGDTEKPLKIAQNFTPVDPEKLGINFKHKENTFNDFSIQALLPQKLSEQGPALEVADINNDGLQDFFIGGAAGQPAQIYIQHTIGRFESVNQEFWGKEKNFEDNAALFFDADGDGDLDLYVTSAGYHLNEDDALLQDRLYLNEGKGNFIKSRKLPKMSTSSKAVRATDFDNDGDQDLVIGGHHIPGKYPLAPRSYLLENENGHFKDVTKTLAPKLFEIGIVNDLIFTDYDNDKDDDLIVVGEWFPITVLENRNGRFSLKSIPEFTKTEGWWNSIKEVDINNDGNMDYLLGNLGENNKFHPSEEKPLHIYGNNFDDNGTYDMVLSKEYKGKLVPVRGKECSTVQNPFVSEKISTYEEFASSSLQEIYGEEEISNSYHKEVYSFSSIIAINNGDGSFTQTKLPTTAQVGPTMDFQIVDINDDGFPDVIGVGSIFEAEVETIRYDSNTGYILLGDSEGNLKPHRDISFYNGYNVKGMASIEIRGETHYIMANNNGPVTIFKMK
ncbi:VCBS repeat-containing protein [Salegentibacter sp. F188]|uniref:VCBS repeat-containing protein n=1 Tax=Autumnicola patrickiae TaxID=3075591 RepID=A0ABU3E327_9FLAO|nr:VCBS repeat-containing protein [Salegentibacter sp. F188]MDT0690376.1 VCBS repeat-containing protein [Salegentibacter sp. F188]